MASSISKKAPKSLMFYIPFKGERGGYHPIKFRLRLIAGVHEPGSTMVTERQAKAAQERAQISTHRWITRRVEWHFKATGTNYGRGASRGFLIYGIPFNEVMNSPKRKKGWEPANHAGTSFWFG